MKQSGYNKTLARKECKPVEQTGFEQRGVVLLEARAREFKKVASASKAKAS